MAMAANKVAGVRAAPAQSEEEVRLTREHNDANVLTLGRAVCRTRTRAARMVDIFLEPSSSAAGTRGASRKSRKMEMYAGMKRRGDS